MPVNAGYEYGQAVKKYEEARTDLEKLAGLQEMMATVPKHKGTENLRREISRKIAKLKAEMQKQKLQAKKGSKGPSINVKKEGIGQIVLTGMPNSGKSFVLKKLTNAEVEVSSYAFTTTKPAQGMLDFKGAKIQLVEVPALIEGSSKGKANGTQILSIIRNADAIILVLNSLNALQEFNAIKKELEAVDIKLNELKPQIEISPSKFPGISIAGKKFLKIPEEQFVGFLKSLGMFNVSVILKQPTTLKEVAQALDERIAYKKSFILLNNISEKKNFSMKGFKVFEFSEQNEQKVKEEMFALLDKVLVYTKKPGEEAHYDEPLVLKKGDTVEDVAKKLHKDFAQNLKYVRVWGSSKFSGQRVSKNYELQNGDLIEIYA